MGEDPNTYTSYLHNLVRLAAYACQTPVATIAIPENAENNLSHHSISFGSNMPDGEEAPFCFYARHSPSLLILEDTQSDPRFAKHPLVQGAPHIRFYAGMPLLSSQGHIIGTLCVMDYLPRKLDPEQQQALTLLAQQAGIPLQMHNQLVRTKAKLETAKAQIEVLQSEFQLQQERIKSLERESQDTQLLNQLGIALQTSTTFEKAYQAIAPLLPQLLPDFAGCLFVGLETQWNIAQSVLEWGNRTLTQPTEIHLDSCHALISEQTSDRQHISSDLSRTSEYSLCCDRKQTSQEPQLFCFPLRHEDDMLGVLHLYATSSQAFSEDRHLFVEKIVNQLTIAFRNFKLLQTLKLKSIRDPLTGLFNRRYFEEILERLLIRGDRGSYTVSLILLDIDHFKRVNDTFGHPAGDAVLRDLGVFLKGSFRPTDIVCRYGGEEFAIILPTCSIEIAEQRAEKLRRGIQYLVMAHQGQNLGKVTISAGVAVFPNHASTLSSLVEAADRALYQAKMLGRDRICIAESLAQDINPARTETDRSLRVEKLG
jgi:diguanylate cyclase (GGDEF)-like protein